MTDSHEWCTQSDQLLRRIRDMGNGPVALDTEADSLHHYPEKICLLQLSYPGRDLLIDPLADLDVAVIRPLLADRAVRKVLHGADYDLRVLDRDLGLALSGLFDTMVASRLCGERQFGLAALLEKFFDVQLDKRFQRADWSRRPLTPEMERYAVLDTHYLIELAEKLERRLRQLERWSWAAEEFVLLEGIRWVEPDTSEAYRGVKGSHTLAPRGLAVLQGLFALRDNLAREADRPPFRILHNDELLRLSRELPRSASAIHRVLDRRRGALSSRRSAALVASIERSMALPEEELPTARRGGGRRVPPKKPDRLRRLLEKRNELADRLDLEHSILGSRAVIEGALERVLSGEDPSETSGLRRWQWDLLGGYILDASR